MRQVVGEEEADLLVQSDDALRDGQALSELTRQVQDIRDRLELRDLVYRYCRAIDRNDWVRLEECFTADATYQHGDMSGSVRNFVERAKQLDLPPGTMHMVGQTLLTISGDAAAGETYGLSFHTESSAEPEDAQSARGGHAVTGVRYVDRFVRRPEGWRISARIAIHEWNTLLPKNEWLDWRSFVIGRRDIHDVSYDAGLE